MTSSKKKLLAMLAAVVIMGLLLLLLTLDCSSCGEGDEEAEHDHEHEDVSYSDSLSIDGTGNVLISRDSDELSELVITNREGTYHISRGESGSLEIAELRGLPVENDFIELAWFSALSVGYSASYMPDDDLASLESFGMNDLAATLDYSFTDGTTDRVRIGHLLSDEEEYYYFQKDGDEHVYVSDFNVSLFQGDSYWLSDDFFGNISAGSVEIGDITLSGPALGQTCRVYLNGQTEQWQRLYGYRYIVSGNGVEYPADDYNCGLLIDDLETLTANEALIARPTAEQISSCGLDKPWLTVTHKRSGAEHTLRLARHDHECMYAMADDIPVIYEIRIGAYPALTGVTMAQLRSPDVMKLYFNAVRSLTVSANGEEHRFDISRTPLSGADMELYEYAIASSAGKATLGNYKCLLEVFNSMQAMDYDTAGEYAGQSDAVLTVKVEFFDERRAPETLRFYPAGSRRYRCEIDGAGDALVNEMWLGKFISDAATADNGGTVTP